MINSNLKIKCRAFQELANYKLLPNSYVIFHIDGKNFSKFCKRFKKPYDDDFIDIMNNTAKFLCEKIPYIKLAYIQSDEITLIYTNISDDNNVKDAWFNNRICKLCSIAASLATSKFIQLYFNKFNEVPIVSFDCKVWNVPNLIDAFEWILYRQIDCIRNSKQMLGQNYLNNKKLLGKNTDEIIEMVLINNNINWYDYNDGIKYGRLIYKETIKINANNGGVMERKKFNIHNAFCIKNNELNKTKILDIIND